MCYCDIHRNGSACSVFWLNLSPVKIIITTPGVLVKLHKMRKIALKEGLNGPFNSDKVAKKWPKVGF